MHRAALEIVDPLPHDVDAGVPVTLSFRVTCSAGCAMPDASIELIDDGGASIPFDRSSDDETATIALVARAPARVGGVIWTAFCASHERRGEVHIASAPIEIRFTTVAHKTSVAVWDVQSPVAVGESLALKVGVRCSAACALAGHTVRVWDSTGAPIGGGRLGAEVWPGTEALYWGEVGLTAPDREGLEVGRVVLDGDGGDIPHEAAEASFTFLTTPRPDSSVTVVVRDAASCAALGDVEVHVGRYHLMTDALGVARADVPSGPYEIMIRKDGFTADPLHIEVAGAVTVQVTAVTVPTMAERAKTLTSFEGYPWG